MNMGRAIDANDLLKYKTSPKEFMQEPFTYKASLTLLYAPAGLGKSLFALGLAAHIAAGRDYLEWKATRPFKALYIDGEMTLGDTKERLQSIIDGGNLVIPNGHLDIVNHTRFTSGLMPPLGTPAGQAWFAEECQDKDLIIVDNLGCVAPRDARQTDEQNWIAIAPQLIKLRAEGKAIILIHHAGKSGEQLGTSLKTQPIDYCVSLVRPVDADKHLTLFNLQFEKIRGKHRARLNDLYCELIAGPNEEISWKYKPLSERRDELIKELSRYLKPKEIAEATGYPFFTVMRTLKANELNNEEHKGDWHND